MEYELVKMLNEAVPYKKFLSQIGSGDKTYDTPVNINCYVEDKMQIVKNDEGEEVISKTTLYMNGDVISAAITTKDLFVVNGRDTPVISRSRYKDEKGILYVVVVYL